MKFGNTTIGGMSFGSTRIGGAKFGNTLVYSAGSPPAPAVMVPYVRVPANDYIDTGITPDQTTKIVIWARNWNPGGSSYTYLFGSRVSGTDSMFVASLMNNANIGKIWVGWGNESIQPTEQWDKMSHYHKYELSADGFLVDDTLVTPVTASTFSNIYNIWLGACNAAGSAISRITPLDYCACKIYKGGVLVRDFTPVSSPSVGLYDAVSDTVFSCAGGGTMTYGEFNKDAYKPLQYITTSGNSYLLTPVIGTYSLPVIVAFSPDGTAAAWYDVVGGRDNTERCQMFIGNASSANSRSYGILGSASATAMYTGNSGYFKGKKTIIVKANNKFSTYYNNAQVGSTVTCSVSSSYSTGVPLAIGATFVSTNSGYGNYFNGKIYYAGFGSQGSFVPAKKGKRVGMYDTINDLFYESVSETPFVAGPEL